MLRFCILAILIVTTVSSCSKEIPSTQNKPLSSNNTQIEIKDVKIDTPTKTQNIESEQKSVPNKYRDNNLGFEITLPDAWRNYKVTTESWVTTIVVPIQDIEWWKKSALGGGYDNALMLIATSKKSYEQKKKDCEWVWPGDFWAALCTNMDSFVLWKTNSHIIEWRRAPDQSEEVNNFYKQSFIWNNGNTYSFIEAMKKSFKEV